MNPDLMISKVGEKPGPHSFIISINQIVDNTATQAQKIYEEHVVMNLIAVAILHCPLVGVSHLKDA
jgi:hypothetical protein